MKLNKNQFNRYLANMVIVLLVSIICVQISFAAINVVGNKNILDGKFLSSKLLAGQLDAVNINISSLSIPDSSLEIADIDASSRADGELLVVLSNGQLGYLTPQAGAAPPNNTVSTTSIQDGAVTTEKIRDGAVTNDQIATDQIGTNKIQDNSITGADINNLTSDDIANDAVINEQSLDGLASPANPPVLSTINIAVDTLLTIITKLNGNILFYINELSKYVDVSNPVFDGKLTNNGNLSFAADLQVNNETRVIAPGKIIGPISNASQAAKLKRNVTAEPNGILYQVDSTTTAVSSPAAYHLQRYLTIDQGTGPRVPVYRFLSLSARAGTIRTVSGQNCDQVCELRFGVCSFAQAINTLNVPNARCEEFHSSFNNGLRCSCILPGSNSRMPTGVFR